MSENLTPELLITHSVAVLNDVKHIQRRIDEETKAQNTMINFDTLNPRLLDIQARNRLVNSRNGPR
ncbi:MAG: hypothetical protein PVG75_06400 [Thioalkalispiraceae bacterium]